MVVILVRHDVIDPFNSPFEFPINICVPNHCECVESSIAKSRGRPEFLDEQP